MSEKDVLQRADKLVSESDVILDDMQVEDPNKAQQTLSKPTEAEEKVHPKDENSEVFRLRRLGYRRETHYKKPRWWMFVLAIIGILFLIALIAIQLPYIPPMA